jgi:ribonucleoside-diphosphate reductase alpha chain
MPVDTLGAFAQTIYKHKYSLDGQEEWPDTAKRVVDAVMRPLIPELADEMTKLIAERKFIPGGRYLYAAGKRVHQVQNCLLMRVGDSKEEWGRLMNRITVGLMTGAGVGCVYSDVRPRHSLVRGMGGYSTGPTALMQMVNESARHIMQGGSRRAALWAGLDWKHPDIFEFITLKNWSDDIKAMKEKDFNASAPMDGTNISVILDDDFFTAYFGDDSFVPSDWDRWEEFGVDRGMTPSAWAHKVFWAVVSQMLTTAEPGFSVNVGENAGEDLRNACTEITSADDDDICNLGSLNLARFDSIEEFDRAVEISTAFLLCGTIYSTVPYAEVADTRSKNRRLGLGLMGVYDWLKLRGYKYGPNDELATWLDKYKDTSDFAAIVFADRLGVNVPVGVRAIAPAGTISIVGECVSAAEALFAVATKRRFLKGTTWHYQYVIDQTAKRLLDAGVPPEELEDAYDLANNPRVRIAFQAWLQQWVDHGISSTINLPEPELQTFTHEEFGHTLLEYLPSLRGITVYPNGARGGQPLTKVSLEDALIEGDRVYEEFGNENACVGGSCGV